MRASEYFYVPPSRIEGDSITIDGDEYTHLARVLRKGVGDRIVVLDGAGTAYDTVIAAMSSGSARCAISDRHPGLHEPPIPMTLGVGLLKNSARFELIVEKGTELGMTALVPLRCQRTVASRVRMDRWRAITVSAMKQCGRCVLPDLKPLQTLREFAARTDGAALRLIPHQGSGTTVMEAVRGSRPSAVIAAIGPEGGFTEEEVEGAVREGFIPVDLGARRLRTETAALTVLAMIEAAGGGQGR